MPDREPDLTTELDEAEEIVMGRTDTVLTEWGVSGTRSTDLRSGLFNAGADDSSEKLARLIAADQEKRGFTGTLVRRTVTYGPWEPAG